MAELTWYPEALRNRAEAELEQPRPTGKTTDSRGLVHWVWDTTMFHHLRGQSHPYGVHYTVGAELNCALLVLLQLCAAPQDKASRTPLAP